METTNSLEQVPPSLDDDVIKDMEETDWTEDPQEENGDEHLDSSVDNPDDDFDVNELECVDEDGEEERLKRTEAVDEFVRASGGRGREYVSRKTSEIRKLDRHHPYRREIIKSEDRSGRTNSSSRKSSASPHRIARDRRRRDEYLARHGKMRNRKTDEEVALDELEEVDSYDVDSPVSSNHDCDTTDRSTNGEANGPEEDSDIGDSPWSPRASRHRQPLNVEKVNCDYDDYDFPDLCEDIDVEAVTRAAAVTSLEPAVEAKESVPALNIVSTIQLATRRDSRTTTDTHRRHDKDTSHHSHKRSEHMDRRDADRNPITISSLREVKDSVVKPLDEPRRRISRTGHFTDDTSTSTREVLRVRPMRTPSPMRKRLKKPSDCGPSLVGSIHNPLRGEAAALVRAPSAAESCRLSPTPSCNNNVDIGSSKPSTSIAATCRQKIVFDIPLTPNQTKKAPPTVSGLANRKIVNASSVADIMPPTRQELRQWAVRLDIRDQKQSVQCQLVSQATSHPPKTSDRSTSKKTCSRTIFIK